MHFFPRNAKLGGRQSDHGLLVLNHDYIQAPLLPPNGPTVVDGKRVDVDEVRKEINADGVSVVEIRRGPRGDWSVLPTARNSTEQPTSELQSLLSISYAVFSCTKKQARRRYE